MNSGQDRIASWKDLRKKISTMDDLDALATVAEYWSYAPLSNTSYDPDTPSEWLSPWEMVSKGEWCRQMLAVAMEFTLRLSGWDESRLKLVHMRDYDISEEVFVLKIDDKYALNYSEGEVVEFPKTEQVITNIWQFDHKTYITRPY